MMERIKGAITAPRGFKAAAVNCGIKKRRKDLAVIYSDVPTRAAALFTTNRIRAAPLTITRDHLRNSRAQAIIINSGNANACTGKRGLEDARLMAELQNVRALEKADRFQTELISTLAHEMRTPLTSIKGFSTALLMEEIAFTLETRQEFLEIIESECDVLTDLIHDLLESSIIDAGLLRLELEPVILPRMVESVVRDIARQTAKHRIVVDFPSHFPIVEADPGRIMQVLRNLLDNAVKYSPQGGMIVIRGQVDETQVVVSVADQGVGIAPEHLNRLFEKFFRVESGLGRHVVGSGLGLPIAQTIIEGHGGHVWAESKLGQGSTFYLTLPLGAPFDER